ncbi:STAS domain-containing protein [bacterium]|nr:STAS domain-containing protein [bacterium]
MEIKDQKRDDFVIISIVGNIVMEDTAKLKEYVEQYIEEPSLNGIIFDCQAVKFIDSSGLGLIVSIFKTLKRSNKKFALFGFSEKTIEIFVLTKLDCILTITDDVETAMEKAK